MAKAKQAIKQQRTRLDKLKHAYALRNKTVKATSPKDKQWLLDSKQYCVSSFMYGWY